MRQSTLFFQTGFRSLLGHKFRSFLSVLGIVCGVMAVMSMISTGEGAKQEVLGRIEKLGLKNIYINKVVLTEELKKKIDEKKSYGLSWFDVERLKQLSPAIIQIGAIRHSPLTPVGTYTGITPNIIHCTGNYGELVGLSLQVGRFISIQDILNNNLVCVLGGSLAQKLGRDGQVGSLIRLNNQLYKVVGVLVPQNIDSSSNAKVINENFNSTIFLPLNIQEISTKSHPSDGKYSSLSQIIVEVDQRNNVENAARIIKRTLAVSHNDVHDYSLVVPLELLFQSLATQKVFNLVLAVTGGIALLVGGIGIMNIMLATVTERKREIGIRRAVGATERDIVYQFLAESFLLTLSGGVIGIAAGYICINVIEVMAGWPIKITVWTMVVPFILACAAGIFFGLYPAIQAARMNPIQALRTM